MSHHQHQSLQSNPSNLTPSGHRLTYLNNLADIASDIAIISSNGTIPAHSHFLNGLFEDEPALPVLDSLGRRQLLFNESSPTEVQAMLAFAYAGDVRAGLNNAIISMYQSDWVESFVETQPRDQIGGMFIQAVENDMEFAVLINDYREEEIKVLLPILSCESFVTLLV
jgi:hypothetical protein